MPRKRKKSKKKRRGHTRLQKDPFDLVPADGTRKLDDVLHSLVLERGGYESGLTFAKIDIDSLALVMRMSADITRERHGGAPGAEAANLLAAGVTQLPPPPMRLTALEHYGRVDAVTRLAEGKVVIQIIDFTGRCGLVEVFVRDGDCIYYSRERARRPSRRPAGFFKEIRRRLRREQRKGRGGRELFVIQVYVALGALGGFVPQFEDHIVRGSRSALLSHLCRVSDKAYRSEGVPPSAAMELALHSLTLSDSPCWTRLSDDLMLMLLRTEVGGVPVNQLKLPSPVFLLELPPGMLSANGADVQLIAVARTRVYSDDTGDPIGDILRCCLFSADANSGNGEIETLQYPLVDGTLSDVWEEACRMRTPVSVDDSACRVYSRTVPFVDYYKTVLRLVANALLYVTAPSVSVEPTPVRVPGSKPKQRQALEPMGRWRELLVGTEIKLDKATRQCFKEGRKPKRGSKITYSFITRGHWKSQAYGPGHSLRKPIWIHPYVKNADVATRIISHTYKEEEE